MFNFNDKLLEGAHAREQAVEYREQIVAVYSELAKTLSDYLTFKVEFYESPEYENESSFSSALLAGSAALSVGGLGLGLGRNTEKDKTGYKLVYLRTADRKHRTGHLFKTKEPDDGYPITIKYQKTERFCYNQSELAEALSDLLSTVFFHDELQKLKEKK
ncbi:hypothetical protein AB4176_20915 [Vibrio splendidus]